MLSVQTSHHVLPPALVSCVQLVLEGRNSIIHSALLLWHQPDCPAQEGWGDSPHCNELYSPPSCCKDYCKQGEGATDLPCGTTAVWVWHQGGGGGAEAAVHATWMYAGDLDDNHWIVKLDFKNVFNSLRRDKMLLAVHELAPTLYPFVHSCYSSHSSLF